MRARAWVAESGRGLLLLAVGVAGALGGQALGIPAGIIVGAMLTTSLYRLAGGEPGCWRKWVGRAGRLLLGTVIGAAFGPDVIAPLKAAILPMAGLIAIMIALGLLLGWILNRLTGLGWATAIISAVPGGLPAMASMAEDLDADATVVAAIHFSRLATILLVVPIVLRLLLGGWSGSAAVVSFGEPVGLGLRLLALAVGSLGGMLALLAHVPTADLVGPILIVGGINLFGGGLGPLPAGFQQAAMLLIGISVGAQMSRESLRRLRRVALPALAMIATLITTGLLLGWGLAQVTPLDLTTALLSGVPGGASTMPLIAHDLGGDMRVVAALHLTRQLVVLVLVPAILGALLRGRQHKPVAARDLPAAGE